MNLIKSFISLFKSKNIGMSGTWRGYYGYSEQYPEPVRKQRVQFMAQISTENDGYFSGTIKESEEGIPEISKIEGRIKGKKIFFDKTYKNFYEVDQTGELIIKDGPQHVIYEGVYILSKNAFSGQWKIKSIYVLNGREQEYIFFGNWSMEKDLALAN